MSEEEKEVGYNLPFMKDELLTRKKTIIIQIENLVDAAQKGEYSLREFDFLKHQVRELGDLLADVDYLVREGEESA